MNTNSPKKVTDAKDLMALEKEMETIKPGMQELRGKSKKNASENEVESAVKEINPDKNSMDSRG